MHDPNSSVNSPGEFLQHCTTYLFAGASSSLNIALKKTQFSIIDRRYLKCIVEEPAFEKKILDLRDLLRIVNYTNLSLTRIPYYLSFTLEFRDITVHLSFEDEDTKFRQFNLLNKLRENIQYERSLLLLILEDEVNGKNILNFREPYSGLVSMFQTISKDITLEYHSSHIPNLLFATDSRKCATEILNVSWFVKQEFQLRRQEETFLLPLRELSKFVLDNFSPPSELSERISCFAPSCHFNKGYS